MEAPEITTIEFTLEEMAQAFVDLTRKRRHVNLDNINKVRFRTARDVTGQRFEFEADLVHIPSESGKFMHTIEAVPNQRKTKIIPTQRIIIAPKAATALNPDLPQIA